MVFADKEVHPAVVPDLAMVKSAADALGSLGTQARYDFVCTVSWTYHSEPGLEITKLENSIIEDVLETHASVHQSGKVWYRNLLLYSFHVMTPVVPPSE
jgi:hypothetical protein